MSGRPKPLLSGRPKLRLNNPTKNPTKNPKKIPKKIPRLPMMLLLLKGKLKPRLSPKEQHSQMPKPPPRPKLLLFGRPEPKLKRNTGLRSKPKPMLGWNL
jgi:hypothetical protein